MDLKQEIEKIVSEHPGIKATALATQLIEKMMQETDLDSTDISDKIAAAIYTVAEEKRILEVEYVTPGTLERVKSMFFPKNTVVRILL